MNDNIEKKRCSNLQTIEFAMQLDESTIRNNESIMMCYVRHNEDYSEYILFSDFLDLVTTSSYFTNLLCKYGSSSMIVSIQHILHLIR